MNRKKTALSEAKARKIAKDIFWYYLGMVWTDLDNHYYSNLLPGEKEMVRFYIHLYGHRFARMIHIRYEPHY